MSQYSDARTVSEPRQDQRYRTGWDGNPVPVREHLRTTGPLRLIIAPAADHTGLLLELASCWRGPYGILYVLLTSRTDRRPGRYQSPDTLSRSELAAFLAEHRTFLEADGRHALWIASREGEGTLVYDRHNVVYAYGALEAYETVLAQKGFARAPVRVPVPHAHHFHEENDAAEERMVELWAWRYSPLREGDDD